MSSDRQAETRGGSVRARRSPAHPAIDLQAIKVSVFSSCSVQMHVCTCARLTHTSGPCSVCADRHDRAVSVCAPMNILSVCSRSLVGMHRFPKLLCLWRWYWWHPRCAYTCSICLLRSVYIYMSLCHSAFVDFPLAGMLLPPCRLHREKPCFVARVCSP